MLLADPPASCCTQSKVPCSESEATLVRPKVKILSWSPPSEQGMVMLCSTDKWNQPPSPKAAAGITDIRRVILPLGSHGRRWWDVRTSPGGRDGTDTRQTGRHQVKCVKHNNTEGGGGGGGG